MPQPAEFKVNATRLDPYKNFKFRVMWDNSYVAGISRVGALTRQTQVITHREGGDPSGGRKSPGQTQYGSIVMERGITHDLEFARWANKVWDHANSTGDWDGANQLVSLKDFRKDIVIEMYNEAGQKAIAFKVFRAWPSAYQAMPELDANGNAIAIQSITLECEGWEQDYDVGEPTEGLFDLPPKA
ncbi:MAG TPA: phage tail protein [Chloroflexota bacterium]|jgi:phage tail-like protein|nr:phage tail protein [Chloroflexota bacterium]